MKERKILKNKTYLYLTEFFSGMALMAVEIGAQRLISPYFSSSQIVWTIIIGTIMIAMALGNVYGGRSADKDPDPDKLYRRILIAAIWLALIPVVGKYVIIGFSHHKKKIIAACLIFAVCVVFGHQTNFAFWESGDNVKYEGESTYNYLRVTDNGQQVALSTNVLFGVQSVYNKTKSLTGIYYDYAMAAPLMTKNAYKDQDVLILGMGSGTFAHQCREYLPTVHCEGVEIDQKITNLARKYFDEPRSTKVVTYDGRAYLNAVDKKYDVIMVDAYQDITIPFSMSSVEFFQMVKEHLNDGGVMVVNMNMRGQSKGSITDYLTDTICSVFPTVYTADVDGSTNRELFASTDTSIKENLDMNAMLYSGDTDFIQMMEQVSDGLVKQAGGDYILTDDKAPVELLGIRVIDRLIN